MKHAFAFVRRDLDVIRKEAWLFCRTSSTGMEIKAERRGWEEKVRLVGNHTGHGCLHNVDVSMEGNR